MGLQGVENVKVDFVNDVSHEEKIAFSTVMMWEAMSKSPDTIMQGQTLTASAVAGISQQDTKPFKHGYGAISSGPSPEKTNPPAMVAMPANLSKLPENPSTMPAMPPGMAVTSNPIPALPPGIKLP
ncbi:unnamed protein product [Symbiodinium sp. CCMP2592]|nr:unnamed protein product [Symbiodinium sp. CCMP2592]